MSNNVREALNNSGIVTLFFKPDAFSAGIRATAAPQTAHCDNTKDFQLLKFITKSSFRDAAESLHRPLTCICLNGVRKIYKKCKIAELIEQYTRRNTETQSWETGRTS